MLQSFKFSSIPEIIFGAGKFALLNEEIAKFGSKTLFITGGKSFGESLQFKEYVQPLLESKNGFLERISGEPSPAMIDRITEKYWDREIDAVVAIGGGSALDAGKAVSAMLPIEGKIKDYLEGVGHRKPTGEKFPFIAIPTTSGTGSETTKNAVISEIGPNGFKKSLRHNNYIPNVAIVDPELVLSCPKNITAAGGMDAFTQLLEAYLSPKCDEMTGSLILPALHAVKRSLLKVCENGSDLEARADMAYAAMISGIALANAGLGTIHGFASPIGALCEIPHGVVCGTLMAASNKCTFEKVREDGNDTALEKYKTAARIFIDSQEPDDVKMLKFIDWLYEITEKLAIPKLGEFGLTRENIDSIVSSTGNKNNPASLSKEEQKAILTERL